MKSTFENQEIHCIEHKESPVQYILLRKDSCERRLLCSLCLYSQEKREWKSDLNDCIPLKIVTQSPNIFINTITSESQSKYLEAVQKICEYDFEKNINQQILKFELLEQIANKIKEQLLDKLRECKETQQKMLKLQEEFYDKIHYNKVFQIISGLSQADSQEYIQLEQRLTNTLNEIMKDNSAIVKQKELYFNLQKPNNEQFLNQLNELFSQYDEFIEKINQDFDQNILSEESLIEYIQDVSNQQVKQKNLIYVGSRDGLNANAFWSKVNGKRNLLMIFKSLNKQIFGGYSPCKWEQDLSNFVKDDTLTSFLFSQTKNQIYPLREDQKQYAIYCRSNYGPIFGDGHDMWIAPDFNSGGSYLGSSYKLDKYKKQGDNQLFDEQSPKIIECEIYELQLQ